MKESAPQNYKEAMEILDKRKLKESVLKQNILKHFKGHPHVLIVPKHQDRFSNTTGVSDLLLCVCGCFVAIELKRDETKEATPKQKWFLSQVLRAGGYPAVCRSVEEVERIVNNIMHGLLKFPYEEVSNVGIKPEWKQGIPDNIRVTGPGRGVDEEGSVVGWLVYPDTGKPYFK